MRHACMIPPSDANNTKPRNRAMDITTQVNAIARHLGINLKGNQELAEQKTKEWISKGWLVLRSGMSPYVNWPKVG